MGNYRKPSFNSGNISEMQINSLLQSFGCLLWLSCLAPKCNMQHCSGARVVCVCGRGWGRSLLKSVVLSVPRLLASIVALGWTKNLTCPSGKLRTKFTRLTAKSTSSMLSDTALFTHCVRTTETLFMNSCVYFSHKLLNIKLKKMKSSFRNFVFSVIFLHSRNQECFIFLLSKGCSFTQASILVSYILEGKWRKVKDWLCF